MRRRRPSLVVPTYYPPVRVPSPEAVTSRRRARVVLVSIWLVVAVVAGGIALGAWGHRPWSDPDGGDRGRPRPVVVHADRAPASPSGSVTARPGSTMEDNDMGDPTFVPPRTDLIPPMSAVCRKPAPRRCP